MKILQVASGDFFSTYGGGQVYVKNIVDEMISMQINVCVLSFVSFHHEVKAKQYKGIPLYEIGTGLDEDIEKVIDILLINQIISLKIIIYIQQVKMYL